MNNMLLFVFALFFSIFFVDCKVIETDDVVEQGLYNTLDNVLILTGQNFDRKVYGQNHGLLVQFYNSFCGHCRAFSPKYKTVAKDLVHWKKAVRPAALDCSVPENLATCREFEVMAYPSVRYIHENYQKGNGNVGKQIPLSETSDQFKANIVTLLQSEQKEGRLQQIYPLDIALYTSFTDILRNVPNNDMFIFLIFEQINSTVGSEVALDVSEYNNVRVIRVLENSDLATTAGVRHTPALVALRPNLDHTPLTPNIPTRANLLRAINVYLMSKHYDFPHQDIQQSAQAEKHKDKTFIYEDIIYYTDLEKTIRTMLQTEIPRYKEVEGKSLQALMNFLDVMINVFPFKGNTKTYFMDLRNSLISKNEWKGSDLFNLVKRLENNHEPVYFSSSDIDYIACKGSQPQYRGYTCGLWTLFHVLTVNAANLPGKLGPEVLRAMHGYVKHFFGCTECSSHFQAMAVKNQLFDVTENDKAILWLWISHNEVNLRLAGDNTEDPYYPKIQFPSATKCPSCRLSRGQWNLPAVYQYLEQMYSANKLYLPSNSAAQQGPSPFSNLDIGMLSLLYILSFGLVVLVIKYLMKGFFRKKVYKQYGWGKV